jgi:hypothetical protein
MVGFVSWGQLASTTSRGTAHLLDDWDQCVSDMILAFAKWWTGNNSTRFNSF